MIFSLGGGGDITLTSPTINGTIATTGLTLPAVTLGGAVTAYAGSGIVRTATKVVAASDAPAHVKAQADYVCDGTSDDVEIQAAIGALTVGRVWIETVKCIGRFNITANILLPSYIRLDLTEATIKVTSEIGNGISCAADNQTQIQIYGGEIDGNSLGAASHGLIFLTNGTNFSVENCYIHHAKTKTGIEFTSTDSARNMASRIIGNIVDACGALTNGKGIAIAGSGVDNRCYGVQIIGNTVTNCPSQGIWTAYSKEILIEGNTCQDNGEGGIWASYDSEDIVIQGNILSDSGIVSVMLGGSHATRVVCKGNTISGGGYGLSSYWDDSLVEGNIFINQNVHSIVVNLNPTFPMSNISIINNTIIDPGRGGNGSGINVGGTGANFVTGLKIINNTISGSNYRAVFIDALTKEVLIKGNSVIGTTTANGIGMLIRASYVIIEGNLVKNNVAEGINVSGSYCTVTGNECFDDQGTKTQTYGIREGGTPNYNTFIGNQLKDNLTANMLIIGANSIARNNIGYIAPSEVRTASGSLAKTGTKLTQNAPGVLTESGVYLIPGVNTLHITTAGTFTFTLPAGTTGTVVDGTATLDYNGAISNTLVVDSGVTTGTITVTLNCIAFAWHNPEAQDILIKKVVINITTKGGTATSELEVGIADDALATNRGTEFFNALDVDAAAILHDSWLAAGVDFGTQVKWLLCQDLASATDGWIVGSILTAKADTLVGSYYIEYVGK